MLDTPVIKIGSDTAAIVAGTVGGVQYRYEMRCDRFETVNSGNRNTTADSLPLPASSNNHNFYSLYADCVDIRRIRDVVNKTNGQLHES